jgi:hypothetical protein
MAFHVYPNANTPLSLASGAASGFIALESDSGPDPADGSPNTSFVRISMSNPPSPTPPQVVLKAGSGPASSPIDPMTNTSIPTAVTVWEDMTQTVGAALAYWVPSGFSNNVYFLKIAVEIPSAFSIQITNNTGVTRDFVWVVGSSDTESQQPWIQVSPASLQFNALVNQTSTQTGLAVQINNRGTGALAASGAPIAAPYALTGLPATVNPNPAVPSTVTIGFNAPATIGTTPTTTYTINGDPGAISGSAHNNIVSLGATTAKLEVAMVLDDSGSMTADPLGNPLGPNDPNSRWSHLTSATDLFLDLLAGFAANAGTIGIVKFPGGSDPVNLPEYDLVSAETIPATMTTEKSKINSVAPFNGTPMDYGLQRALTATAPPYFATDALSIASNRRWLVLLSDGAWNVGNDPRSELPTLKSGNIIVYSFGFGRNVQVDYPTLQALAVGPNATPGGIAGQVATDGSYNYIQLAHEFKKAMITGLTSVNSIVDPIAIFHAGQAPALHPVTVTSDDTKAAFTLTWNTPDAKRMSLELVTPNCELITAEKVEAGGFPGVTFSSGNRHQLYVVSDEFLRNAAQPGQPRYGVWRMVVTSLELARGAGGEPPASETYSYDVMVESSLKMEIELDRKSYYAGDEIKIAAKLTRRGAPVTSATVKVALTSPGQAMANWLAGIDLPAEAYERAKKDLEGKDANAIYIKAFAAQAFGKIFDPRDYDQAMPMTDLENRGIYRAVFPTMLPDSHKLYVTAVGITADGSVFRREKAVEVIVGVRADPVYTLVDVRYRIQDDQNLVSGILYLYPRDRFGNVILIDPTTSKDIELHVTDATLVGPLTSILVGPPPVPAFNGGYQVGISYKKGARPTLTVVVGGLVVFKNRPIPPVDRLHYVDQILEFKPGIDGGPGTNQHPSAKDVLGDIRAKPATFFTSLGGYGSVTVGLNGQVVQAEGEGDVTVFVEPDSDLRPYRVEATKAGQKQNWVTLGDSAGTGQSFGLKKAGIDSAVAIRITDTSGRTKGAGMEAIPTPGVSIRGVGIAKSAPITP